MLSWRRVLAITTRIIRQVWRDRRTLALIFLVPILVLSLLGYIYRGASRTVTLVLSAPESPFSRTLAQELATGTIRVERADPTEAVRRVRDGHADAALLVEGNSGTAPTLRLVVDGAEPGRARQIVAAVTQAALKGALRDSTLAGTLLSPQVEYLAGGPEFDELDTFAPVFISFFAFFFVYLLTSVSFLRERLQGSIERLIVSPLARTEIILGYMLGFSFYALIQSILMVLFTVYVLRIHTAGPVWSVILLTVILTLGAVNLGIFLSTFARTELQVVQFIPLVISLQGLLSGIIWPVETLPRPLRWLAQVLPLTWANDALRSVMLRGRGLDDLTLHLAVLVGFALLMLLLAMTTLRREVA